MTTTPQEQPYDFGPEQAVLGSVLIDPTRLPEVSALLRTDDFFLPAHRDVFEAMGALAARRVPVDVVTLADELISRKALPRLEGGETYLLTLANAVPTAENVPHYADIIARRAALRRFKLTLVEIAGRAEQDPDEAQRMLLTAQHLLTESQKGRRAPGVDLADLVRPVLEEIEQRADARRAGGAKLVGITTWLTGLDYLTGGFCRGTLNIIAARTSLGKTSYACQVALLGAIERDTPALFFSLEMTPRELAARFFSRLARVDSSRIRTGELDAEDFVRLQAAGGRMDRRGMVTISNTRSLAGIVSEARAFRVQHPNQEVGVFVDYLQLVRASGRGRSREEDVSEASGALKELAQELDCPFVVPAQLNRGPEKEDRDPKISDIRDSGAIEQDADVIAFIVRKRGDVSNACSVVVGKNRNGRVGEFDAQWHGSTFELRDDDVAPLPGFEQQHWERS